MPVLNPKEEKIFQGSEKIEFGFVVASDFTIHAKKIRNPRLRCGLGGLAVSAPRRR